MTAASAAGTIRSTIPARLDRLSWSPFRAEAIAVFFAIAQLFGALGPAFYGWLIGDGSSPTGLYIGYLVGGGIMISGGIIELIFGIKAEGKSLEEITKPITAVDTPATVAAET